MKLYFSPTSPYVRKCLLVASQAGLMDQIELVNAQAHPVQRDTALVQVNPLGKIPCLVTDSGQVLHDSRVICEYLDHVGGTGLFPRNSSRWDIITLQALGDGILDAALSLRYENAVRPEALQWADWQKGKWTAIETSLQALQAQPGYFQGPLNIGQISVLCALWYLDLRYAAKDWPSRFPTLATATEALRATPLFTQTWSLP
jgi:glutathione S-transferase